MQLLLDTHIYIWAIKNDPKLSSVARSLMAEASKVYVSSISILEISIKAKLGKLKMDVDVADLVDVTARSGFLELPVTMRHAAEVYNLANLHRDPFDRILMAQALSEPLVLLTADETLKAYSELVRLV